MSNRQTLISAVLAAGATNCYAKINKEYHKTCDCDEEGSDNPEPFSINLLKVVILLKLLKWFGYTSQLV